MKSNKLFKLLGVEKIFDNIQQLFEVRSSLLKKEIENKLSEVLAKVLPLIFVILFGMFFLLFVSIALSMHLSSRFNSYLYGFGLVALFYLIITIIFIVLAKNNALKDYFLKQIKSKTQENS